MNTTENALMLVFSRNAFYRRLHYLILAAFVLALAIIIVLIGMIAFILRHRTQPFYFPTDTLGRLIRIVPTNQPNMPINQVMQWTINAVQATYSYDYINYHTELQQAQAYFTDYGWKEYMTALTASNNLNALTTKQQIVIAQVVGTPKIIAAGLLAGSYAWKFQMPVLITYWQPPYNDNSKVLNPLTVSVIVQRQPILKSDHGLGIVQLIGTLDLTSTPQQSIITSTPNG